MDLIKIGKYIAGKRKELGLTQKQLAEKLGMSDKSVSKWERGVCLPDVSVYIELCDILKISINEFLAGEDISSENFVKKSEDNLIQVTTDSKHKQKSLKSIIAILIIAAAAAIFSLGISVFDSLNQPQNYISPFDRNSAEIKTAELLSGTNGAFLFKYFTNDEFKTLTIYKAEYSRGELVEKSEVTHLEYSDIASAKEGIIAFVPDFDEASVKIIVTDDYAKYLTDTSFFEKVENREYNGRMAVQLETDTAILYDNEQGLLALVYGENSLRTTCIEDFENSDIKPNDYACYFSFMFSK